VEYATREQAQNTVATLSNHGFVEYATREQAQSAVATLSNHGFGGVLAFGDLAGVFFLASGFPLVWGI
jgi:hypothetical protein